MSKDVDENCISEEVDEFLEQDLLEGVFADVEKIRCDEFDKQVQDSVVGVLMYQLEMKEIEVGELYKLKMKNYFKQIWNFMKKNVNSKDKLLE